MSKKTHLKQERRPISRQGIHALYTFTPFKLLRAQPDQFYSLLLVPISYLRPSRDIVWRSRSCKKIFYISLTENISKKVVQPHQLYPQVLTRESDFSVEYRMESEIIERRKRWIYPPTYAEFSWNSLNSGYYCVMGWTLISSSPTCPQEKYCPFLKGSPCKYYAGPTSYASLYNVFPRIQKKYEDPVSAYAYEPIFAIRYRNSPLAIIRFTEQGNFVAFIDRVVFAPKLPWILLQPNVFLKEGLGFEINNVHAIEFDFSPENLREFIIDHLKKHKRVTKWLVLKYNLFMGRARDNRIKEKRGFRAFRELDNITYQVMENEVRPETRKLIEETLSGSIDDNIIDFASFVFLHTFAHVMKNIFVARYGCKSEDINYYIEHPKLQTIGAPSERVRLIILETAMGGYGYLKNFIEEIKQAHNTELFEYLISTAIKSFESCCESKSMDSLKRLPTELRKFEERNKEFVDLILRAYHMVFPDSGLYPHVNSIRRALVRIFPVIPNESRSLLDDMLAKGPHCWDGCQLCVMLERECNFLPFDQPFLVSRGLIKACMSTMKESLRNASLFFPLKKGLIKEFQEFCNLARDKIYIASPWISPEIVDQLYFLFKNRGVIIRILTKIDPNNEVQVETIKKLREITSKHAPAFEARIMKELHGKGMLIDGIMALHGSFNFTLSGLNSNVENVTIDYDIGSSRSFEEQFEKHWKQAIPIISIHKQDENK